MLFPRAMMIPMVLVWLGLNGYHLKPCGCLWTMLLLEPMVAPMLYTVAGGCVDVRDLHLLTEIM